jgi:hypothetical protein
LWWGRESYAERVPLALIALWFFIVYGSKISVIYVAGTWLFGKLFQRRAVWMDLLALLAGTVVYALLRAIPYVGWVFGILVSAAGAGSGWLAWRQGRHKPEPILVEKSEKMVVEQSLQVVPKKKAKRRIAKA